MTIFRRNKYKLQHNLHQLEPIRLHTLIEVLNFRLIRYFKYHYSTKELFLDIYGNLMKVNNHQLWQSMENVLIKISLLQRSALRFSKASLTVDFGETLNRVIPITTARTLVMRWVLHSGCLMRRVEPRTLHMPEICHCYYSDYFRFPLAYRHLKLGDISHQSWDNFMRTNNQLRKLSLERKWHP